MSVRKKMYRSASFSLLFTLIFPLFPKSQNLLVNPGFEDINVCTEYTATCAIEGWFYIYPTEIPYINTGVPSRFTGRNSLWVPVTNIYDPAGTKQLIYTMLMCPLVKGKEYKIKFLLSSLGREFYKTEIGFSTKEPASIGFRRENIHTVLPVTPENIIADMKADWKMIELNYTAKGNELFFVIGNISNATFPYDGKDRMSTRGMIYYFIDDILLEAKDKTPLCPTAEKMKEKMYAQNYRHTNRTVFDSSIIAPQFTYDTIRIPANAYFETDKAILKPEFKNKMDSITTILGNRYFSKIEIIGHTDSRGGFEHNMQLSRKRAEAVKAFMIKRIPKIAPFVTASGKGQTQPIDDNETEEGRARNRRVEIVLTCVQMYKQ